MANESRPSEQDTRPSDHGLPEAAGLVILMLGIVAAFLVYRLWLGANQCIKVGGCG